MAIKTTLEQLEEVQAAIREAEVSEELGDGQSRVRRANLEVLHKREERLLDRYHKEQGTGGPAFNNVIVKRG